MLDVGMQMKSVSFHHDVNHVDVDADELVPGHTKHH
jgi:hypothetical protein